jgi:hypothetical protein
MAGFKAGHRRRDAALGAFFWLWWLGQPHPARAKTFADNLSTSFEQFFARSLAESIGRSLPVTAASSGVVFTFDPTTGAFTRQAGVTGQLFLERATPIGRGKLNVSFNYQRVDIDTLEGADLGNLSDEAFPVVDPSTMAPFRIPRFAIKLDTQEVTASATYGITDDLEVNLTVPVLYSDFGLDFRVVDVDTGHSQVEHVRSSKLGVGDMFVRGKYRLLDREWASVASGLVIRVPSGNQDNFQGTGTPEVAPMLYISRDSVRVTSWLRLTPYFNGGVNLNIDEVDASEGRYGVGLDGSVGERGTAAVAFLARQPFQRVGRPGLFDAHRVNPITGQGFVAPLFGIENKRPDFFDLAIGGRVHLWRDTLIGFANVIVPLNRDGFRSDAIPTVGFEVIL